MLSSTSHFLADVIAGTIQSCGRKPNVAALCEAMDKVFESVESVALAAQKGGLMQALNRPRIACAAGCKWCCHQQVGITPAEAIRIAHQIDGQPPDRRASLAAAVHSVAEATRGMTTSQYVALNPPCGFLDDHGACAIYPVRPLRCRSLLSTDAAVCRSVIDDFEGTARILGTARLAQVFPADASQPYDTALAGLCEGLGRLSKPLVVSLELHASVSALLRDPGLGRRWLAGARPDQSLNLRPDAPN